MKCQKEGDFGFNSDQIVFYERAGFHSGAGAGLRNDVQINVAYLDSHVRSVTIANNINDASATSYPYEPTNDGEPNYFNFDNSTEKKVDTNPPKKTTAVVTYDPRRYSDSLP